MSTILGVEVLQFHRTLDGRSWNPIDRWRERRAALVLVLDDAGRIGVGEAWAVQAAIERVLDHLGALAPGLIGGAVADRARLVARALPGPADAPWVGPAAASALDLALADLAAQAAGQPLWRALGGADGRVRVYASGGLYRDGATADDLAPAMAAEIAAGFTAVKMKIGALALVDDLARVRAVRATIGPDATLWVDAVNQLRADASLWCAALRDAGVAAIQAPLPVDDLAGMARLNPILPVIAGEAEHRSERFAALLDAGAVSMLQLNLGLCGGFAGAQNLARMAATRGITVTPQCHSTAVLQAASLHFGAACGTVSTVEVHRFHDHLTPLMPDAMRRARDGIVALGDAPGLGLAVPRPGPARGGGSLVLHRAVGHPLLASPP